MFLLLLYCAKFLVYFYLSWTWIIGQENKDFKESCSQNLLPLACFSPSSFNLDIIFPSLTGYIALFHYMSRQSPGHKVLFMPWILTTLLKKTAI